MSKRDPKLLFLGILESLGKIKRYTSNCTFHAFLQDSMVVDAVIRNFEIIGEAANRLPEEFKDIYSEINWFGIKGFRNRIVHDYIGIDYQTVWNIIENDLDFLELQIEKIVQQL